MPGRSVAVRVCAAVTLTAGSLCVPAAARAAAPPALPVPARVALPPGATAACHSDGASPADRAVADRIRSSMTGPRLGRAVTGGRIACARAVVQTVKARGLPQRAAVIAVTTVIAESTLLNHTVAHDHDSLGLFQQRPSMGWGRTDQLVDPRYATNAFLDAMIRKYPAGAWMTGDIGRICQRVQTSAVPGAYAPEVHDAEQIVAHLWGRGSVAAVTPIAPSPAPESAAEPDGPFQRPLSATYTGLGATDQRHRFALADFDGDKRPDLVVVQGADTTTGKTEVRVMNGAANFQSLLLHTVTALGATDDRHAFSLADWNTDGRPDLVAVQRSGTASGRTEIRILDGASAFRRVLLETATTLGATDDRHAFSLADWNTDGRPDLLVTQTSGTASRRTEVRVVDGASLFQRDLVPPVVTPAGAEGRHEVFATDFNGDRRPDLALVQTSGTASGRTEVRVLDGASGLSRTLLQSGTALGPLDDRHDMAIADWDADGKPDLLAVQRSGTASGRTEALILAG